ncbi:phosphofructokinase [Novosphingobium marinum]|uniref:Phosphofructokinase n=1 Tax=Novosphingobium marinum TaxID=1514948 RepID=A0A7Z0BVJ4_9SPHN|nr:1-phosphofructokinase family hexose kinase [Novosphingobium marinum]NYH96333.1 6-phosphofructokinase 2 [Novosphingobium marinum]GGC34412.1 phosphofructokinase [Novosphingobium marinum]
MKTIATLTMNPTIDLSYEVDEVRHTHKMRGHAERHAPGGGGINVARVFVRLGGHARCFYLSGGATGVALDGLLDLHQLVRNRIAITGETRIATNVFERASGKEYRFVPPGPVVTEAECAQCLDLLETVQCDYLVASGSLPPGVPAGFYAQLASRLRPRGIEVVLDTSGPALGAALAGGGFALVKPSQGELEKLVGRPLATVADVGAAAMAIVDAGGARLVAVTMGHEGAVLAGPDGTLYLPAIPVEAKSAVGAGDSFLAAMVHRLASGSNAEEAFRFGMAGGTAAVLTPGTDLARPADMERLYRQIAGD